MGAAGGDAHAATLNKYFERFLGKAKALAAKAAAARAKAETRIATDAQADAAVEGLVEAAAAAEAAARMAEALPCVAAERLALSSNDAFYAETAAAAAAAASEGALAKQTLFLAELSQGLTIDEAWLDKIKLRLDMDIERAAEAEEMAAAEAAPLIEKRETDKHAAQHAEQHSASARRVADLEAEKAARRGAPDTAVAAVAR